MRRSRIQSWLHLLRALLLAATAWIGFTIWAWISHPEWIRGIGERAVASHVGPWEERLAAAREVEELAAVADDLARYRAGDRLGEVRRRALDRLVDRLAAAGRLEEAAGRSGELVDFDPRDVAVRIRHGELLAAIPGRSAEGVAALRELCGSLPADPRVAVAAARVLFARGRAGEAMGLLVRRGEAVQPGGWTVDWGSDFLAQGFVTPLRNGPLLEVRFELPPGAGVVRVMPPPYCSLRLENALLTAAVGTELLEVPLAELEPEVTGGSRSGSDIVLDGAASSVIRLRMPESLRAAPLRCALVFEASPGHPAAVVELLTDPATQQALSESDFAPESPAARLLHEARLQAGASERGGGRR